MTDAADRLPAARESVDVKRVGPNTVVATYKLGGREYPMKTVGNCVVCMSHHRVEIERQAIKGQGWAGIARSLPDDAGITSDHIGAHLRNGHLPIDLVRRNAIFEERAREVGRDLVGAEASLVDHIGYARHVVQRRTEWMLENDVVPDAAEATAAARLLATVEQEAAEGGFDEQAMLDGFLVYAEAIQKFTTPEQFQAIAQAITTHPTMRRLLGRAPRETTIDVDSEESDGALDGPIH